MESALMKNKECFVCATQIGLHDHHIFPSSADRPHSEARGLKVWLCAMHHNEVHAHPNKGLDLALKVGAQKYYEEHYGTRDDFRKEFRKSYL